MKVLAHILGSKLTNHWGIVLAFFVYIHFVPNFKFGAKVYIFINVRKTALSDCLPSAAVCKDSLYTDFSSNIFLLKDVTNMHSYIVTSCTKQLRHLCLSSKSPLERDYWFSAVSTSNIFQKKHIINWYCQSCQRQPWHSPFCSSYNYMGLGTW